jgi:hypothetical protein
VIGAFVEPLYAPSTTSDVDLAVGLEQIQAVVDRVLYQSDRVDPGAEYALEGDVRVQRSQRSGSRKRQRDDRGQRANDFRGNLDLI